MGTQKWRFGRWFSFQRVDFFRFYVRFLGSNPLYNKLFIDCCLSDLGAAKSKMPGTKHSSEPPEGQCRHLIRHVANITSVWSHIYFNVWTHTDASGFRLHVHTHTPHPVYTSCTYTYRYIYIYIYYYYYYYFYFYYYLSVQRYVYISLRVVRISMAIFSFIPRFNWKGFP